MPSVIVENMYMFIVLNVFCLCSANKSPKIFISDNVIDNDRLLFGNVYTFDDMYMPLSELELNTTEPEELDIAERNLYFDHNMIEEEPINSRGLDAEEFNELLNTTSNFTRRWQYYDPDENYYHMENVKKDKLKNLLVQYVVHARYYIKRALTMKEPVRNDKRYKLGYLFNRLRRLQQEQLKIVTVAKQEEQDARTRNIGVLLRKYEKVVRYDVDIRDTIKWIQAVDKDKLKPYYFAEYTPKIYTNI